jgi:nucleoside-diphosphate-sugar epimerase
MNILVNDDAGILGSYFAARWLAQFNEPVILTNKLEEAPIKYTFLPLLPGERLG